MTRRAKPKPKVKLKIVDLQCQWCGRWFRASRSDALTCSPAHRKSASRWAAKKKVLKRESKKYEKRLPKNARAVLDGLARLG